MKIKVQMFVRKGRAKKKVRELTIAFCREDRQTPGMGLEFHSSITPRDIQTILYYCGVDAVLLEPDGEKDWTVIPFKDPEIDSKNPVKKGRRTPPDSR